MNKQTFFVALILGLLLSNMLLLGNLFWSSKHPKHHQEPKFIIIERLKLDNEQVNSYEKLIQQHRSQIKEKEKDMMDLRNSLFKRLNSKAQPGEIDSLMQKIGQVQAEIEKVHFEHFQDIRSLCKPAQLPLFEDLANALAKLFNRKLPPGP